MNELYKIVLTDDLDHLNVNLKNEYGSTLLHYAARDGHLDELKKLLEHGADPNLKNNFGAVPLHYAAWKGHTDCVKELLEHGANPNLKDNWKDIPLHDVIKRGQTDCVKLLIDAMKVVSNLTEVRRKYE